MTRAARHRRIREGGMSGSDLAPAGEFRSDPAMERLSSSPQLFTIETATPLEKLKVYSTMKAHT